MRAKSALVKSNDRLKETIVRAPIDGVILQKYVEAGQIISSGINSVSGGTALADIADMELALIEAGVDEIDVGKIRVGQQTIVVAEAYPRIKFERKIIRIAPEAKVEQNVTLFDVVIEVDNSRGRLKSGMNATVEITIVREENVLMISASAINQSQGNMSGGARGRSQGGRGQSGFGGGMGRGGRPHPDGKGRVRQVMLKQGDEFVEREVEIGTSDFRKVVIKSGLEEGDIIGVPMFSRLKQANDKLEQRIKSSRSFGASSSNSSSSKKKSQGK